MKTQNKKSIRIDVILPFHKVDSHLFKAIRSVVQTRGPRVRLVLVNTSRESSQLPTKQLKALSEIEYEFFNLPGASYATAINEAVQHHLDSDYVALQNSDDVIGRRRFERQLELLRQSNSDLALCRMRKFNRIFPAIPALNGGVKENYDSFMLNLGPYGANATLLCRTSWIRQTIPFQEVFQSDWLFALDNYPSAKLSFLPEIQYFYRIHRGQITRKKRDFRVDSQIMSRIHKNFIDLGIPSNRVAMVNCFVQPNKYRIEKGQEREFLSFAFDLDTALTGRFANIELNRLLRRKLSLIAVFNLRVLLDTRFWKPSQLIDFLLLLISAPLVLAAGARG